MKNSKIWLFVPTLKKCMDEGVVKCFYDDFLVGELSDKHKDEIKKLEDAYGEKCGLKVIAVLEQIAHFPDGENPLMTCYVYIDKQAGPWLIKENIIGFMALVDNEDWGVKEIGSIGVRDVRFCDSPGHEVTGWIRRAM